MNILIIGSGGREHALTYKTAQSKKVKQIFVAPGNAGTASTNKTTNININVEDIEKLAQFALDNNIDLTIVGPEVPLVAGIVDLFKDNNLKIFGPSKAAAQLEGSKAFSKDFLQKHNIPTASYGVFSDKNKALNFIQQGTYPIVIKADGLAAGKGVIIAENETQALEALSDMLDANRFGDAGHLVVIEEFLEGEEVSFICMVDGKNILPLATSQDHKARDNGDLGPNTGGMGAYSPAPRVDQSLHDKIMQQVITPTVNGMIEDGHPFCGFLYAGLMISSNNDIKTLEFNVRFGDPETQPILMRLKSDLAELCEAGAEGRLDTISAQWDSRFALGVVMAAGGYPDSYEKGLPINGLDQANNDNCIVFHAGTDSRDNQIVTTGGRVLCVVGMSEDIQQAQNIAYEGVKQISFKDAFYRDDIGHRAISNQKT